MVRFSIVNFFSVKGKVFVRCGGLLVVCGERIRGEVIFWSNEGIGVEKLGGLVFGKGVSRVEGC